MHYNPPSEANGHFVARDVPVLCEVLRSSPWSQESATGSVLKPDVIWQRMIPAFFWYQTVLLQSGRPLQFLYSLCISQQQLIWIRFQLLLSFLSSCHTVFAFVHHVYIGNVTMSVFNELHFLPRNAPSEDIEVYSSDAIFWYRKQSSGIWT